MLAGDISLCLLAANTVKTLPQRKQQNGKKKKHS